MDNDDKVGKNLPSTQRRSRREIQRELLGVDKWDGVNRRTQDRSRQFEFEKEFSKTKKNKNTAVKLITIIFIAIVALTALGITSYIQFRNRRIRIEIADFEDVNLKDLLNVAKKNENDQRLAKIALVDLNQELETKIAGIRTWETNEITLIRSREHSEAERERLIRNVRLKADRDIESLKKVYGQRMEAKEREIEEIQKKIDAYDTRMMEQAKQQEEILNNQQRLHDLELQNKETYYEGKIKELTTNYTAEIESQKQYLKNIVSALEAKHQNQIAALKREHQAEIERLILKYNPVFTGEDLLRALNRQIDPSVSKALLFSEYQKALQDEAVMSEEELEGIRGKIRDMDRILNRMKEVPYTNSVPKALDQLQALSRSATKNYEDFWNNLLRVVNQKNETIKGRDQIIRDKDTTIGIKEDRIGQFQFFLETLTHKTRENGYVIDPRNLKSVLTFIKPIYPVADGDVGLIFRRDDEYIGSLVFHKSAGEILAEITEIREGKSIEPFDKILLQKK